MLLTARHALDKGYHFSLCCPACRTLRVIHGGLAQAVIASGQGDRPLRAMFEAGLFRCSRHGQPASFMSVSHNRDNTIDEIACWKKNGPAGGAGRAS